MSKVPRPVETIRTAVGVRMDAVVICPRGKTMGKGQYSRKRILGYSIRSGGHTVGTSDTKSDVKLQELRSRATAAIAVIHYLVVTGKKAVQQQHMAILQDLGTRTVRILLKLRNSPQIFVEKLRDRLEKIKFGRRHFLLPMGNHTETKEC